MPVVIYSREAENDLIGIAEFIARDKPQAARRWVQTIQDACETLAAQPGAGEVRTEFGIVGVRSFAVGNYVIFFRAVSVGIEVARVIHGGRDWQSRY